MSMKKISADLPEEVCFILDDLRGKLGMTRGQIISAVITTFCNPESAATKEVLKFLRERLNTLPQEISQSQSGEFGRETIKQKLQTYTLMLSLMSRQPVELPDDFQNPMSHLIIDDGELIIPKDWLVLNPDDAVGCKYAAAVECRHAAKFGIPHFVFLSSKKYASEYTTEDIEHVKQLCVTAWPEFKDILERQVEPVYDPVYPGKLLNEEEYFSSPLVEIFTIFEDSDPLLPTNYEHPYGAMITRTH